MSWYNELLEETYKVKKRLYEKSENLLNFISTENSDEIIIIDDIFYHIEYSLKNIIDGWSPYYITDKETFKEEISEYIIKNVAKDNGVSMAYVSNILNKIKLLYIKSLYK